MAIFPTLILGLAAGLALLAAGYLFGIRKDLQARESLRTLNRIFARDLARYRERPTVLQSDDGDLRSMLKNILAPLVQRERLTMDLSNLDAGLGQNRDIAAVLDQIADKGNFSSVLLSDDQGWRVALSSAATDPDRLTATAALLLVLSDRIGRDGAPAPISLVVHDSANTTTLCRLFTVGSQRMTLTAVATGSHLTPLAIDPALAKIHKMLLKREPAAALPVAGAKEPVL